MHQHHVLKLIDDVRISADRLRCPPDHFKTDGCMTDQLALLRIGRYEAGTRRALKLIDLSYIVQQNTAKQKITVHAGARASCGIRKLTRIHRMHEQAMQEGMMLELCSGDVDGTQTS